MKMRTTRSPFGPRRKRVILRAAEGTAAGLYEIFRDPTNRGPAFIWPDTLFEITRKMAASQLAMECSPNGHPTKEEETHCSDLAEAKVRELVEAGKC